MASFSSVTGDPGPSSSMPRKELPNLKIDTASKAASECSDVPIDPQSSRSWSQDVLGMAIFDRRRSTLPTYSIPRKEVKSSLVTPSDENRQSSFVASIVNSSSKKSRRSEVSPRRGNSRSSRSTGSPESKGKAPKLPAMPPLLKEGEDSGVGAVFRFSSLLGSKKSKRSSIDVAVGGSEAASERSVRQFVLRKESRVDRGSKGIGPELRIADATPDARQIDTMSQISTPYKLLSPVSRKPVGQSTTLNQPLRPSNVDQISPLSTQYVSAAYYDHAGAISPISAPSVHEGAFGVAITYPPLQPVQPRSRQFDIPALNNNNREVVYSPIPELGEQARRASSSSRNSGDSSSLEGLVWEGENDFDNPMNWRMRKKCYHTFVGALYTFVMYVYGSSTTCPDSLLAS